MSDVHGDAAAGRRDEMRFSDWAALLLGLLLMADPWTSQWIFGRPAVDFNWFCIGFGLALMPAGGVAAIVLRALLLGLRDLLPAARRRLDG